MEIKLNTTGLIGKPVTFGKIKRLWYVRSIILINPEEISEKKKVLCITVESPRKRSFDGTQTREIIFRCDNLSGETKEGVNMSLFLDRAKKIILHLQPPEQILSFSM